jgi:predicted DNA-binding transcriptional regulator YafY
MDMSSASPAAKSLRTLELLQQRPGITADELAERLGISDRAVRRHITVLRDAGIPVESVRGPYGGYRLGRALHLAPLVFTANEALSLVMAVLDGHHAGAEADDPVAVGLGKLIQSLPQQVGRQAAAMREHALSAPDRRFARPDPAITNALIEAIAARRGVRLDYRSESGREWQTDVDPWAIVVRFGRWYLLCFAHEPAATRTYRVDRIQHVTVRNVTVTPPADLDPITSLEHHLGTGWEFDTHVVFDAPHASVSPHVFATMGTLTPLDDGTRCELRGSTSNPTMYASEWLARIPFPFRVVGGPELTAAVTEVAARMSAAVAE